MDDKKKKEVTVTSKDNSNILDYIIKETKKQGYEFKSLDEFV